MIHSLFLIFFTIFFSFLLIFPLHELFDLFLFKKKEELKGKIR